METILSVRNEFLSASVSSRGAELQSVRDPDGAERLWCGDPAWWAGRAPVLFPVAGGFREDRYELDGASFPMQKHGFARTADWEPLPQESPAACAFELRRPDPGFPWDYRLVARYALDGPALRVSFEIENLDPAREMVCSFGAHEAWAAPGGVEGIRVAFDEEEDLAAFPVVGNLLSREARPLAAAPTHTLDLHDGLFAVDAVVFRPLRSRGATLSGPAWRRPVRLDFPEHPFLLVWTKPGAPFVCVEPWCNLPDFGDAPFDVREKPGFLRVAPGARAVRTHSVSFPDPV